MQTFHIPTHGPGLYEFTDQVRAFAKGSGLLTLFVRHTSASLLIQENADPEVQADLQAFFHLTHTYEGPDDMPAHIKAAMMPVSLSIPVQNGRLALGTWQGIYLFEHRNAPHSREAVAHLA